MLLRHPPHFYIADFHGFCRTAEGAVSTSPVHFFHPPSVSTIPNIGHISVSSMIIVLATLNFCSYFNHFIFFLPGYAGGGVG